MKAMAMKASSNPLLRRLAGEAGLVLGLRIFASLMSYVSVVFLARWLSLEDYGRYGTIMSAVGFAAIVLQFGTTLTSIRYLGEYEAHEKHGLAHGVIALSLRVVFLSTLVTALVGAGIILALQYTGRISYGWAWAAGLMLLPAFTLTDVQSAIMRSFGQIYGALLPKDVLWRASVVVIGFGLFLLVPSGQRLALLLLLSAVALSVFALWQQWALHRGMPGAVKAAPRQYDLAAWRATSVPIWLLLVSRISFRTIDVIVVGLLLSPAAAGIYFAASRTSELLAFVLSSLNLVVGPNISKLYAAGKHEDLERYMAFASLVIFIPALLMFIGCVLFPDLILSVFGSEFEDARWVLILMAFGQLYNAATGSVGVMLNMSGHERINARIMITTAPLTVLGLVVLAWFWGVNGAAVASCIGIVIWNTRLWHAARKHTAYDPSIWGAIRFMTRAKSK